MLKKIVIKGAKEHNLKNVSLIGVTMENISTCKTLMPWGIENTNCN